MRNKPPQAAQETSDRKILGCMRRELDPAEKAVVREILDRISYHIDITRVQSKRYHILSEALHWTIPILSAWLTFELSSEATPTFSAAVLSLVITILSVINSTFRPAERFAFAVAYSNKFWEFHTRLVLDLEEWLTPADEGRSRKKRALNDLLRHRNREAAKLIEEFNTGQNMVVDPLGERQGKPPRSGGRPLQHPA